jgi:hypothetical protein
MLFWHHYLRGSFISAENRHGNRWDCLCSLCFHLVFAFRDGTTAFSRYIFVVIANNAMRFASISQSERDFQLWTSLPVLSRQGIVACAYLHAFTRSRFVDVCPTFSHFDARVLRDAVCRSRSPSNSWHVSFCIFVLLLCSFLSTSLLRLLISFSFSQCSSHVYLRFLYQLPLSFMQSEWCRQQRVARSHVAGLLLLFSLCASTVMSHPVASSSAPLFAVVRSPRL